MLGIDGNQSNVTVLVDWTIKRWFSLETVVIKTFTALALPLLFVAPSDRLANEHL